MKLKSAAAAAVLAMSAAPSAYGAERAPALAQVTAPHSYYWREMYVPQLTSGPSSLAWAPDGKALYFSMQGRIWRQRLASERAEEITTAAGYDYQPDVSPDGRALVFSRRDGDAINLVLRDLKSGKETPLTTGDAVNIDARWSPEGTMIAYVTTAESGNFHIATAERSGEGWAHRRWRPETQSFNDRYYYAQVDHELSPAWSPDGKRLFFISNENVRHGSGRIVSQPVDLSAPPEIIRDEETNWKARPEVSPEGKRIAYSSYAGRQWHQLWMTTTAPGGFPVPFTYGDFDIVNARWSPDGSKIAFVSNETGGLHIEVMDVVGGARRVLKQKDFVRKAATAALRLRIVDAKGAPAAARVAVRGSDGRDYAPADALIRADDYRDTARGVETHYYHSDGDDVIALPPGETEIRVWRGLSATPAVKRVSLPKNGASIEIALDDLTADFSDWKSGDVHTHMNYGGAYRERVEGFARQADAEALDLAFNLIVNKEQRIPDIGEFSPVPVRPDGAKAIVAQAQEFHTSVWGHLGLLGLDDHVLIADYAGYPETAVASLYPDNAAVAKLAHEQSALVGYVHPYDPPAPDPHREGRLSHSFPADVALGLVDYVEVVGFSDHAITEAVWARLLNCGFRLPAAGGTDAMTNYASLRGPIGLDRTYVEMGDDAPDDPAAFARAWLDGLKAGKSFATNSALLKFELAGEGPGGEIRLKKGAHRLKFSARMESIAAVKSLDVIVNGAAVKALPLENDGKSATVEGELTLEKSGWVSLRAASDEASSDVFDLYPYAITSPVYVTVGGKPVRSREDADYFISWIDRLIDHAAKGEFNTEKEREIVLSNFRKARREFEKRR